MTHHFRSEHERRRRRWHPRLLAGRHLARVATRRQAEVRLLRQEVRNRRLLHRKDLQVRFFLSHYLFISSFLSLFPMFHSRYIGNRDFRFLYLSFASSGSLVSSFNCLLCIICICTLNYVITLHRLAIRHHLTIIAIKHYNFLSFQILLSFIRI